MSIFQKFVGLSKASDAIDLAPGPGRRLVYRALEPRMVFDAAIQSTLAEAVVVERSAAAELVVRLLPSDSAAQIDRIVSDTSSTFSEEVMPLSSSFSGGEIVVFVDSRVMNFQDIAGSLPSSATVVMLDRASGGLEQIARYLDGHANVAGVQIFSHGTAAHLQIGADILDNSNLAAHSAALQQIGRALGENGDILLYGCDLAADNDGRQFVEALAALTGGDVAASTDATGSAALGGDWMLELTTGAIEAATVSATGYQDLLGQHAVDDVNVVAATSTIAITGNVLTNDTVVTVVTEVQGRTVAVGIPYATTYGTITLNGDGTYSYVVDANNSTVSALLDGQSISDIIAYTATDGSTIDVGYLTVTINGADRVNSGVVAPVIVPVVSSDLIAGMPTLSADAASVVFVDPRITNYQQIIATIAPGSSIIVLNPAVAGLEQIAAYLQGRTGIASIQILSHGAEAQLQLGSDWLTNANLVDHQEALSIIGQALVPHGDILIYGCDVAAGADGQQFIASIAQLTGNDVAASTDTTGSADRGGNWVLESQVGTIATATIHAEDWAGELATFTINTATAPTVVTGAHVGGPLNGDTATYANVGTAVIGGVTRNINLVGTITASTVGDTIAWGTAVAASGNNAASLNMSGGTEGGQVTIRWALYVAGTTPANSTPFFADINIAIGDIDGISATSRIESVSASQTGLLTYSVANPTNLIVTSTAGFIRADGTANESGTAPSIIQYSWLNSSAWDITYTTAVGQNGRVFNNDGSGTYTIPGAVTIGSLLDLDANNSTQTGFNYQNTFVENGAGIAVVDTDVTLTNIDGSALSAGATFTRSTLVLTNAQTGDALSVGALPTGMTATVDTSVAGRITVTLSGSSSAANYLTALQAVTFSNSSDAPVTTDRSITVTTFNGTVASNPATATLHVTAVDDAPISSFPAAQTTLEDTRIF